MSIIFAKKWRILFYDVILKLIWKFFLDVTLRYAQNQNYTLKKDCTFHISAWKCSQSISISYIACIGS